MFEVGFLVISCTNAFTGKGLIARDTRLASENKTILYLYFTACFFELAAKLSLRIWPPPLSNNPFEIEVWWGFGQRQNTNKLFYLVAVILFCFAICFRFYCKFTWQSGATPLWSRNWISIISNFVESKWSPFWQTNHKTG